MTTALLLLEIQNDYFPNGRMPLEKSLDVDAKAQAALYAFRDKSLQIIHVQHISTHPNASYFLPCTKGAEFHPSIAPEKGEIIVKKHYPNSFKDTTLLSQLTKNKINHLVICGMMTHLAIDATVRAAFDLGFRCTILHDACTTQALEINNITISAQNVHYAFLAALRTHYATIMSSDEYLQKAGMQQAVAAML